MTQRQINELIEAARDAAWTMREAARTGDDSYHHLLKSDAKRLEAAIAIAEED